ncbi:MAG: HAMP domain-containing histidine kinase [Deltaproteobacteria bacterium]|nr:HAMP domain-containing histidine kinase [Deltaproteobacteria bacterium]
MNQPKWFFHPISVFILSIIALGMSLFLYIYWYVKVSTGLDAVVRKFHLDPEQVLASQTWVVIMVLSILVAVILAGIFVIFVYNQKTFQLYRLQNNFINNFTHELKTPVTSIKLYLETFLKKEIPGNDREKYIGYMLSDVNRLGENINSILNLARIESKNFKGEFIRSDIVEIIKRFCDSNSHLFQGCIIQTKYSLDRPLLYPVDKSLFEMLLMNLITNAVKYNESDKPRIDISFTIQSGRLHIYFSDNGVGIEKAEQKKIFKKFYQVGEADNMSARGSGIGLYMAQSIAKIQKGRLEIQSNGKGKGSTFTIILPIKKTDAV